MNNPQNNNGKNTIALRSVGITNNYRGYRANNYVVWFLNRVIELTEEERLSMERDTLIEWFELCIELNALKHLKRKYTFGKSAFYDDRILSIIKRTAEQFPELTLEEVGKIVMSQFDAITFYMDNMVMDMNLDLINFSQVFLNKKKFGYMLASIRRAAAQTTFPGVARVFNMLTDYLEQKYYVFISTNPDYQKKPIVNIFDKYFGTSILRNRLRLMVKNIDEKNIKYSSVATLVMFRGYKFNNYLDRIIAKIKLKHNITE